MPENPNNPHTPSTPPTLADKQIDLSPFALIDLDPDEIRKLPKPKTDFSDVARQVLALYPEYKDELRLSEEDFDPAKVKEHLDLAEELTPYAEWLEKRNEQVRETRMKHLADAYRAVLALYHRSQAAEAFDPQVGYAFAFLADHFGAGKKRGKKE
ncbi:MAG: hypothetical protein D3916_15060 [Candidatus Electrothrix sp. MAN1_4]|nr:hypothetical protein [Candidatus Electrothrix sp. MAN1_4]